MFNCVLRISFYFFFLTFFYFSITILYFFSFSFYNYGALFIIYLLPLFTILFSLFSLFTISLFTLSLSLSLSVSVSLCSSFFYTTHLDGLSESDLQAAIILKEIQSRVDAAYAVTQEVRSLSDGEVDFPLCRVRIVRAREFLANHAQSVTSALLECIVIDSRQLSLEIITEFQEIETQIAIVPTNENELAKLQRLMESSPVTVDKLCNDLRLMHHRLTVANNYQHNQSWNDFESSWNTWLWVSIIKKKATTKNIKTKKRKKKTKNKKRKAQKCILFFIFIFLFLQPVFP